MGRTLCRVVFPLACLLGFAAFADAAVRPLSGCNNKNNKDVPKWDVSVQAVDAGVGLVNFVFSNNSKAKCSSITNIYFDDEAGIFSTVVAMFGEGTAFHKDRCTRDLPGGESLNPPFETTDGFSFSANHNSYRNGINPGESATITIGLVQGYDFGDISAALGSGDLRVGISCIGNFGGGCGGCGGWGGKSGSALGSRVVTVNVPLPATGFLFAFGTVLLRKFGRGTRTMARPAEQVNYLEYGDER